MISFGIADLSWLMHKNAHAVPLSITRADEDGNDSVIPTGHVYGTVRDIQALAPLYDYFILAVDSKDPVRKSILPSYKEGRRREGGEERYNIFRDLDSILVLATSIPNCRYIRMEGYEADDIIASYLALTDGNLSYRVSVYHNDKDILQTPGRYEWFNKIGQPPVDRVQYLSDKYGFDPEDGVDWLPLLVKMVRGDASDNVPAAVPRFPSKMLVRACSMVPRGLGSYAEWERALLEASAGSRWEDVVSCGRARKALKRNYDVVCPRLLGKADLVLRRMEGDVQSVLSAYRISSLAL